MPELPDITVYTEALRPRVTARSLERITVKGPFFVRTFDPPTDAVEGFSVTGVSRLGKRIVLELEREHFVVIHLMIAGRLLWKPAGAKPSGRIDQAALSFGDAGTLVVTEASTRKRAGLWVVAGRHALAALDPGGLDVMTCPPAAFAAALRRENRTLKRALTNPRVFNGIGNAYSDEILHAARLSPVRLTSSMTDHQCATLLQAARATLSHWTEVLRAEFGMTAKSVGRFPGTGDITAFRSDFSVHGKYKAPCPVCGDPVQRIVHAESEVNYCATCQTDGKVLADRSLSRLLKDDWPRTIEEWEETMGPGDVGTNTGG